MFSELQKLLPQIESLDDKRLLLVTSAGKSGSTWLQKILDGHPEILCAGEAKMRQIIARTLNAIPEYDKALKRASQIIYNDENEFRAWAPENGKIATQFLMALAFATMNRPIPASAVYVGNKDTDYLYDFHIWKTQLFPEAKFIHIIRDVRDVAVSNIHHLNRQGAGLQPGTEKYYESVQRTTDMWIRLVSQAHDIGAATPETYMEVKYESLLDKPCDTVRQVFSYLSVDAADETVTRCVDETSFEKLSGGRRPGQEDRDSFYRKGVSGDWKNALDAKSLAIVDQHAGPLLARLGYARD